MSSKAIDPKILAVALDRATGQTFEDFVSEFQAGLVGSHYVPVGGSGDGGADGYTFDHVRSDKTRPDHFLQTSVVEKVQTKITSTINRLRKVGRTPQTLTYFSSRAIPNVEQMEYDLTDKLQVMIRIRDRRYITAHINDSPHTRAAFNNHLHGLTLFLQKVGATPLITKSTHVKHPDAFVFLRQEVDRRQGKAPLVDSVIDALAVWALEGTDPDKGITMTGGRGRYHDPGQLPLCETVC